MNMEEILSLTSEELDAKTVQLRKQSLEMKMQFYTRPAAVKASELKNVRKTIARLLTVKQERRNEVKRSS